MLKVGALRLVENKIMAMLLQQKNSKTPTTYTKSVVFRSYMKSPLINPQMWQKTFAFDFSPHHDRIKGGIKRIAEIGTFLKVLMISQQK
jgi:hypothetical protein